MEINRKMMGNIATYVLDMMEQNLVEGLILVATKNKIVGEEVKVIAVCDKNTPREILDQIGYTTIEHDENTHHVSTGYYVVATSLDPCCHQDMDNPVCLDLRYGTILYDRSSKLQDFQDAMNPSDVVPSWYGLVDPTEVGISVDVLKDLIAARTENISPSFSQTPRLRRSF